MSLRRLTTSAGLLAATLVWGSRAAGQERHSSEKFTGKYSYCGAAREGRALAAEIDRVANKFSVFVRGIARKKMRQGIHPYPDVLVERIGSTSRVQLGRKAALICDGTRYPVMGEHGAPGTAVCSIQNGRLMVRAVYDLGVHTNLFWLSRDGKFMRMRTTVSSPKLPDKVEFTVTYVRR